MQAGALQDTLHGPRDRGYTGALEGHLPEDTFGTTRLHSQSTWKEPVGQPNTRFVRTRTSTRRSPWDKSSNQCSRERKHLASRPVCRHRFVTVIVTARKFSRHHMCYSYSFPGLEEPAGFTGHRLLGPSQTNNSPSSF
jgi:hypothetical protein